MRTITKLSLFLMACGSQRQPIDSSEYTPVHVAAIQSATQYVVCDADVQVVQTTDYTYAAVECTRREDLAPVSSRDPFTYGCDGCRDIIRGRGDEGCLERHEVRQGLTPAQTAFEIRGCSEPITVVCGLCGDETLCDVADERSNVECTDNPRG